MTALTASGLGVALGGRQVLQPLDVAFSPGQVTAIIGPNGAGKSTLLSCLAGLRRPKTGAVWLDDARLLQMSPRARAQHIGFIPQTPEIAWAVEVRILVGLGRTPYIGARGLSLQDAQAIDRAMAAAGVEDLGARVVTTLSGGERARVLIARALAGEPKWLLADEPLAGLDPGHQADAGELFHRLAKDCGAGVILTMHDLTLAARIADRILVLSQGRILADGPPAQALEPGVLESAYGVRTRLGQGMAGPLVEILGRKPAA